jgi:hypothetical protein
MKLILSDQLKAKVAGMAKPDCPDCSGEGWYTISWNNSPDREDETICECVLQHEDGPRLEHDLLSRGIADDGATEDCPAEWFDGGFAENH